MPESLEDIRDRLHRKLIVERRKLAVYDDYLEGEQPLRFISPEMRAEMGERLTKLVFEMPGDIVRVYDERLDVESFRFPGSEEADDQMKERWSANDGEILSQQVHQEALGLGRAYALVGPGDSPEMPLLTAESPFDTIHEDDPRTHDVRNGLHEWTELDKSEWRTVYTPEGRQTWWRSKAGGSWREESEFVETRGDAKLCALVPFINRPRMLGRMRPGRYDQRLGRSEFDNVISIIDAMNKLGTDMMTAAEFHAMPRRWAFGLKAEDFVDENGKAINAWSMIAGRLWANENPEVKVGQFAEADLGNFRDTIKVLIQIIGQQSGLPPYYTAFDTVNPPSADAIRSSEVRLVKGAERKISAFGNRWSRVQRLMALEATGTDAAETARIETVYRSPSTPTRSQEADATTKLVATRDGRGRSIVPVEQAREDLGYGAEQRKRMAEYDNAQDPNVIAAMKTLETAGGPAGSGS